MKTLASLVTIAGLTLTISTASAQTLLSHSKALAGGGTPGDTPGYPITLIAAGTYKLTSNLLVPPSTKGIVITGANVTLDLNGFTVNGGGICDQNPSTKTVTCTHAYGGDFPGIDASIGDYAIIRNGRVKGFTGTGIRMKSDATLTDLEISHNTGHGVQTITSDHYTARLENLHVLLNEDNGIDLNTFAIINKCRLEKNGGSGLAAYQSYRVLAIDSLFARNKVRPLTGAVARGTVSAQNGAPRTNVVSLGNNIENDEIY